MSRVHYIAASKELPTGNFGGRKPKNIQTHPKAVRFKSASLPEGTIPLDQIIDLSFIKEDEIEEYESFEDAAGIFIEKLASGGKEIGKQFKNSFIYRISGSWGDFYLNSDNEYKFPDMYAANKKCLNELFDYIRSNMNSGEKIEFYTCWIGEESEPRAEWLDTVVDLNNFQIGSDFEFFDRQYVIFSRKG